MKNLTFLLIVLLIACQPSKENLGALKDEVMAIHDEVMPKMGELRRVRMNLMKMADSIQMADSVKASNLISVAEEMGEASEGMMGWMRQYEPDFKGTDDEVKVYLDEQKKSIQEVKESMLGAIEKGQAALNQN